MIGERIKEVREKSQMTQSALAKRFGISRSAVNAWEMGISVPSAQYLVELSLLFGVSTDYLLGLDRTQTIDISFLDEEEKQIVYALLNCFKRRQQNEAGTEQEPEPKSDPKRFFRRDPGSQMEL